MHPIERLRHVARASGVPQHLMVQETASALAALADDPRGLVAACRRVVSHQPESGPLLWLAARVITAGDPAAALARSVDEARHDSTSSALAGALADGVSVVVLGWPDQIGRALTRTGDVDVLVVDVIGEGRGLVHQLAHAGVGAIPVPPHGLGGAVVQADLVLLESAAIGPTECLALSGSLAAASVARHLGVPVWLVGGVGRQLPQAMWDGMRRRVAGGDPRDARQLDAVDEVLPLDLVDRVVGQQGPESLVDAMKRTDCPVVPELFNGEVL